MTPIEYLDYANELGYTDYRIAQYCGLMSAAITAIRRGNAIAFSDEKALIFAELVNLDAIQVIADMHAARSKTPATREFWKKVASLAVTSVFAFSALDLGNPEPSRIAHNV